MLCALGLMNKEIQVQVSDTTEVERITVAGQKTTSFKT